MLMYRRTQGQPITLYYRKSIEHRPRMVPKDQYAQAWEAEAKRIQGLFELEQAKVKALADELEEAEKQLQASDALVKHACEKVLAQSEKYAKLTDKYCEAVKQNIELKKQLSEVKL